MASWPQWTLFFLACLVAVLLAKVLDERDRRLRASSRARSSDPPAEATETASNSDRNT